MSTDNDPAEFQIDDTYSVPVCIYCKLRLSNGIQIFYLIIFNFRELEQ